MPLLGTISSTSQCSPDLAEQVSNFCSPYGASGCFLGPEQRALFIAIMFHQDDIYVGIKILNHNPGEGCQGNGLLTLAGLPPCLMKSCTPTLPGTCLCFGKAIKQKYPIAQPNVSRNASLLCTVYYRKTNGQGRLFPWTHLVLGEKKIYWLNAGGRGRDCEEISVVQPKGRGCLLPACLPAQPLTWR